MQEKQSRIYNQDSPSLDASDSKYRLGLWIRDSTAGGT